LAFATNGAEALEQLEQHRPDVAVLDMRLPDTDGIELLRRIRVSYPDLPVIITTAYLSIEPQLKVLDLPHSGYIVKPFRLDELGARIDAVL
jgi:DNA-binding response OmpR family regulator